MARRDDEDARRCPYCHEYVPVKRYRRHVARHEERLDDGQQRDHVTLPPEERRQGDIDGIPRVYRHRRCGVETVMPEEIVRSYLENPFLYNDQTFCCGCKTYVSMRQCAWTETGQRLDEYFADLKVQAARDGRAPKPISGCVLVVLLGTGAGFGLCLLGAKLGGGIGAVAGGFLGLVLGAGTGLVVALLRSTTVVAVDDSDEDDDEDDGLRRTARRRRDFDD